MVLSCIFRMMVMFDTISCTCCLFVYIYKNVYSSLQLIFNWISFMLLSHRKILSLLKCVNHYMRAYFVITMIQRLSPQPQTFPFFNFQGTHFLLCIFSSLTTSLVSVHLKILDTGEQVQVTKLKKKKFKPLSIQITIHKANEFIDLIETLAKEILGNQGNFQGTTV